MLSSSRLSKVIINWF